MPRIVTDPNTHVEYVVLEGPGALDWMNALFYGAGDTRHQVTMKARRKARRAGQRVEKSKLIFTFTVLVDGAQREDGSGKNWIFRGWITARHGRSCEWVPVTGFYETHRNSGRIFVWNKGVNPPDWPMMSQNSGLEPRA